MLFRVLIPSWRFFDDIGAVPSLWFRTSEDGQTFTDWLPCPGPPPARSWTQLLLNDEQNAHFACHSLIERFADDVEDPVSKELIENLVSTRTSRAYFQYKLEVDHQELYLSPVRKQ